MGLRYRRSSEKYAKENNEVVMGDNGLAFYVVIQYEDTRKHAFESDFCFLHMKNGDLDYCGPNMNKSGIAKRKKCTK